METLPITTRRALLSAGAVTAVAAVAAPLAASGPATAQLASGPGGPHPVPDTARPNGRIPKGYGRHNGRIP
jgi:hypothetical protein